MIDYVVSFPRGLRVNLNNIPDDFEDQIKDCFTSYTEGTAKDYTYQDKLAFIDLIAQYINKKIDAYTAIRSKILEVCEYDLDNEGRLPDDEDFRSIEFMEECFMMGRDSMRLYTKVSGDHHIYDEVMKLECRAIRAVMEWGENIETELPGDNK